VAFCDVQVTMLNINPNRIKSIIISLEISIKNVLILKILEDVSVSTKEGI